MIEPSLEELGNRQFVGLEISTALHFGNEPFTFYLCFTLAPAERMPFALARTALGITNVDDNSPPTRRTLDEVPFHDVSPFDRLDHATRHLSEQYSRRLVYAPSPILIHVEQFLQRRNS